MKIPASRTPFFARMFYEEWMETYIYDYVDFSHYVKDQYNLTITRDLYESFYWDHAFFIFDSEEDYFLTIMKLL